MHSSLRRSPVAEQARDPAGVHIRVMPELRSQRISVDPLLTPGVNLYFSGNFDVVGIDVPPNFHRVSLLGAMWRIAVSRAPVLELPEPLWARFLPKNICLALAWTVSGLVRGRWRRARTYAIENNSPLTALFGDRTVPPPLAAVLRVALGLLVRSMYEKIAFGTDGAATSYRTLPGVGRMEQRTFLELPSRPAHPDPRIPTCSSAVFVGHLSERKGVPVLLEAWTLVETRRPELHLHVVGSGPLEAQAASWAQDRPRTRTFHGHLPRHAVLELLPTVSALVAPSIRWGRWREQVGLQIPEALEVGLTVVTTTETGLAPWLRDHGHQVVETPLTPGALADALVRALDDPLPRQQVLDSLPVDFPRQEADRWLHS